MLLVKWAVAGGFWICLAAWLLGWLGKTPRYEYGNLYADFRLSFPEGTKTIRVVGPYLDFETRSDLQKMSPLVDSFHRSMEELAQTLGAIAARNRPPS